MDWYEEWIEPGVREIVRLLRNNGFNTTCSCGHEMYAQMSWLEEGELKRLHDLLFNNGYRNYSITLDLSFIEGIGLKCWAEVRFFDLPSDKAGVELRR